MPLTLREIRLFYTLDGYFFDSVNLVQIIMS